jgi:hypothetical protein
MLSSKGMSCDADAGEKNSDGGSLLARGITHDSVEFLLTKPR